MNASRKAALALICLSLGACAVSPAPTLLTLERPVYSGRAQTTARAIVVGPLTIPETMDRPQLLQVAGAHQLALIAGMRWAQPLRTELAVVLAAHLAQQMDHPRVQINSVNLPAEPYLRLGVDVLRLEIDGKRELRLEAIWTLCESGTGKELAAHRLSLSEPLVGTEATAETIAAGHSRAVARLATGIAAVLRALPP